MSEDKQVKTFLDVCYLGVEKTFDLFTAIVNKLAVGKLDKKRTHNLLIDLIAAALAILCLIFNREQVGYAYGGVALLLVWCFWLCHKTDSHKRRQRGRAKAASS